MVSEYYYFFHKKPALVKERNIEVIDLNDPDFMNKWIVEAAETAIKKGECYKGHCVPLHKFVYYEGKQIITHVLKMENLSEEFQDLMQRYQLPVKLEHHNSRKGGTYLGVDNLTKDAITKIDEWAGLDFEYFGYKMLDPSEKKNRSKHG